MSEEADFNRGYHAGVTASYRVLRRYVDKKGGFFPPTPNELRDLLAAVGVLRDFKEHPPDRTAHESIYPSIEVAVQGAVPCDCPCGCKTAVRLAGAMCESCREYAAEEIAP